MRQLRIQCEVLSVDVVRLEEDGKVLSPEELLYRCVHFINHTHDKVRLIVSFLF